MAEPRARVWYLEYDAAAVPPQGAAVVACNAAPVRGTMIEAAGRAFHHKVLVVNGLAPAGAAQTGGVRAAVGGARARVPARRSELDHRGL